MSASTNQTQPVWRVSHHGRDYGCFTDSALRERIMAGQVAPDAQLQREGNSDPPISVADFLGTQKLDPPPADPADELLHFLKFKEEEPAQPVSAEPMALTHTTAAPVPAAAPSDPAATGTADDTHVAILSETIQRFGPFLWEPGQSADGSARDRIVILGRRQSGKTIYLAALYSILWDRLSGLAARASTGAAHRQLMTVARSLKAASWPAATQGTMEVPLVVDYRGIKQAMVVLDYAGELFTKAFFRDQIDAPEVAPLLQHIDHAAAVILLVDPMVTVGLDHEAIMEDDFGLVQAVRRIRESPGGKEVPVVFVLTKADVHVDVVNQAGGLVEFVRKHFASLARLLGQLQIYQVSAVQTELGPNGQPVPRADSVPFNIEKPLLYCMEAIAMQRQKRQQGEKHQAALQQYEQAVRQQRIVDRRQNRILLIVLMMILIAGIIAVALIIWFKFRAAPAGLS